MYADELWLNTSLLTYIYIKVMAGSQNASLIPLIECRHNLEKKCHSPFLSQHLTGH